MTTPPTDRPLTAGDVPLLREGDVLRDYAGRTCVFDHMVRDDYLWARIGEGSSTGAGIGSFTYVSRPATPASDDWIEWHGGENPVPGQNIYWRNALGEQRGPVLSNEVCGFGFPSMAGSATIIAYRLSRPATSAASAAEGDDLVGAATSALNFLNNAVLESGVCFCGDPISGHTVGSGHSPVDDLAYHSSQIASRLQAALASPPVSERERELEGAVAAFKKAADPVAIAINRAVNAGPSSAVRLTQSEAMAVISATRQALAVQPAGEVL